MPLLSSREICHEWAEGYWWGFWTGVLVMLAGIVAGVVVALWWIGGTL